MHPGPLIPARFLRRLNRFVCSVILQGREELVLLRNTGRLKELLVEGAQVYLKPKEGGRYRYELFLVKTKESLVCLNAQLTPRLLTEYMLRTSKPWKASSLRYEWRFGHSRFDLLINGTKVVEVKSVTLVRNRTAMFPDAPTLRGRRHLQDLLRLPGNYEPAVVFVVQREDAERFTPNRETDPEFAEILKLCHRQGLTVKAFLCRVREEEVSIQRELPVIF